MNTRTYQTGFSLIELMVTMAIIGTLSAIAIPAYNSYVSTTNKSECDNEIAAIRLAEEEFFITNNNIYVAGTLDGTAGDLSLQANLLGNYTASAAAAGPNTNCTYVVALGGRPGPAPSYTITATGVNALNGLGVIATVIGP